MMKSYMPLMIFTIGIKTLEYRWEKCVCRHVEKETSFGYIPQEYLGQLTFQLNLVCMDN